MEQSRRPARCHGVRAWRFAVLLAVAAACRGGGGGGEAPEPVRPVSAPAARVRGAPPSGAITAVAITEAADAAITADEGGGWRLWPTLDGGREPVALQAPAPAQVVLGRDGEGLLAAVLDKAGAIELIRASRDGVVTGRARLPAEPGFDDLVAFSGGILALRRDQVLAWYDARGALRARLAPLPGEFLVEVTARRGRALVGIGKTDRAATAVRLLAADGGALRWGADTFLPDALRRLALSPDHRRVAGIRVAGGVGQVIELGGPKILEDDLRAGARREPAAIGFLASGPAVMVGVNEIRRSPADSISIGPGVVTGPAVFGDAFVVAGYGQALALVDRSRRQYLGYQELGVGEVRPAGAHFTMAVGYQLMWLDDQLAATHTSYEPGDRPRIALDERLLVELTRQPKIEGAEAVLPMEVAIRDPIEDATNGLGTWASVFDVKFDPRSRVLAISAGAEAHRFVIGARGAARRLPSLQTLFPRSSVYPVDPGVADGVVAVGIRGSRKDERSEVAIERYRERGIPTTSSAVGRFLGVDETGAVWLARDCTVTALRGGEVVARAEIELAGPIESAGSAGGRGGAKACGGSIEDGSPSPDGTYAVVRGAHEVVVIDARGAVRWRRDVLRVMQVAISGDGKTVAVAAPTGLSAFDAVTGDRRAWACGWHFGLHDRLSDESRAECRPD